MSRVCFSGRCDAVTAGQILVGLDYGPSCKHPTTLFLLLCLQKSTRNIVGMTNFPRGAACIVIESARSSSRSLRPRNPKFSTHRILFWWWLPSAVFPWHGSLTAPLKFLLAAHFLASPPLPFFAPAACQRPTTNHLLLGAHFLYINVTLTHPL
jgi:hypothetical protein